MLCFHGRSQYAPWFACATWVPIGCGASAPVPRKRYLLPQIFRHETAITCEHTKSTNTVKDRRVVSRLLFAHSYPDSGGSSLSVPHSKSFPPPPAIHSPPLRPIVHGQEDFVFVSVGVYRCCESFLVCAQVGIRCVIPIAVVRLRLSVSLAVES